MSNSQLSPTPHHHQEEGRRRNFSSCSDHSWIKTTAIFSSLTFEFEYFFFCELLSLQHKTLVLWYTFIPWKKFKLWRMFYLSEFFRWGWMCNILWVNIVLLSSFLLLLLASSGLPQVSLFYLSIEMIQSGKLFLKSDSWSNKAFKKYEDVIQIKTSLFDQQSNFKNDFSGWMIDTCCRGLAPLQRSSQRILQSQPTRP